MKQILAVIPLVIRKIRLFAWIGGFVLIFDGLVDGKQLEWGVAGAVELEMSQQ